MSRSDDLSRCDPVWCEAESFIRVNLHQMNGTTMLTVNKLWCFTRSRIDVTLQCFGRTQPACTGRFDVQIGTPQTDLCREMVPYERKATRQKQHLHVYRGEG